MENPFEYLGRTHNVLDGSSYRQNIRNYSIVLRQGIAVYIVFGNTTFPKRMTERHLFAILTRLVTTRASTRIGPLFIQVRKIS